MRRGGAAAKLDRAHHRPNTPRAGPRTKARTCAAVRRRLLLPRPWAPCCCSQVLLAALTLLLLLHLQQLQRQTLQGPRSGCACTQCSQSSSQNRRPRARTSASRRHRPAEAPFATPIAHAAPHQKQPHFDFVHSAFAAMRLQHRTGMCPPPLRPHCCSTRCGSDWAKDARLGLLVPGHVRRSPSRRHLLLKPVEQSLVRARVWWCRCHSRTHALCRIATRRLGHLGRQRQAVQWQ